MRIKEMLPICSQHLTEFVWNPHKYWLLFGRCFGALLIILRGALFSILKLTPATSENDPWFEPKSGPSILLRQVVEMRIIRQERGDKTNHQDAEFAVFTRLPGYFAALSRHYIAPSDCAVTNEKSPAYGSVFCCLCKARFLCGYRMEQFAFFRLMRLAPKYRETLLR